MENQQHSKQALMQLFQDPNIKNRDLIESPLVAERFEFLYKAVNGIANDKIAHGYYEAEKFHFLKRVSESKDLPACTKMSLYGVFLDIAVNGLSFDPSMKHVYVYSRSVNIGTKDNPVWEKRAVMDISPYGELLLRQQQGQIKYADNPVLVYEGDEFTYGTKGGRTILEHMAKIPRVSDNIIAGYIKLTRADDSFDYKVMAVEDVLRLKEMSKDKNSVAWNGGFPGMVMAKVLKHAFKNFPKLRVGQFSKLQSETIDEPEIDYGIDVTGETVTQPVPQAQPQQGEPVQQQEATELDF